MPRGRPKNTVTDERPVAEAAPPAEEHGAIVEPNSSTASPTPSTLGRGSRRRATRVDYRAALQLDLEGDEDEDGGDDEATGAAGNGRTKARRGKRAADDDYDDDDRDGDFQFAEQGEEAEEDDYMELDPQEAEDDGSAGDMDVDDDGSIASDDTPRRGRKTPLRGALRSLPSGRGRRATQAAVRTSLQKRAGDSVNSKNIWPIHEQQPMYLPGKSHGGLIRVDEILPLKDIGLRKPKLTQLPAKASQISAVEAQRSKWIQTSHHIAIRAGPSNDLMVDTRWYPGRDPSKAAETAARARVAEYWRHRRNGEQDRCRASTSQLETVGGVLLLDSPVTSGNIQILQDSQTKRYRAPKAESTLDVQGQMSAVALEDFVEKPPLPINEDGDFAVLMGGADGEPQAKTVLKNRQAKALGECGLDPSQAGYVLNAGAFIPCMDWAPQPPHAPPQPEYLAVAVHLTARQGEVPQVAVAEYTTKPSAVQVWSIGAQSSASSDSPEPGCRLEYQICLPSAEVTAMKWMPGGWDLREEEAGSNGEAASDADETSPPPRIGILACCLSTEKVVLFALPRPQHVEAQREAKNKGKSRATTSQSEGADVPHIVLKPIMEFPLQGGGAESSISAGDSSAGTSRQALCLDWAGGERLFAGCSDGSLVVWPVASMLRSRSRYTDWDAPLPALPSHSYRIHETAIISLSLLCAPPRSSTGAQSVHPAQEDDREGFEHDACPRQVFTACLDGTLRITDTDTMDLGGFLSARREPGYATAFMPFLTTWITERSDNLVRLINAMPGMYGKNSAIGQHHGRITALDASPFHPLAASGGADGAVKLLPALKNLLKDSTKLIWPLYRLDLNRATGHLRYVDGIMPGSATTRANGLTPTSKPGNKGKKSGSGTGANDATAPVPNPHAWHPSIRVTCVRWNPNVGGTTVLASAAACGLVRIDWVGRAEA